METGITRKQAKLVLSHYKPTSTISRVYDFRNVSLALITLIPNFEYPEWSFKTIDEVNKFITEDSKFDRFRKPEHE